MTPIELQKIKQEFLQSVEPIVSQIIKIHNLMPSPPIILHPDEELEVTTGRAHWPAWAREATEQLEEMIREKADRARLRGLE